MSQLDDFLKEIDTVREAEKVKRTVDDLMHFVRRNWRLFTGKWSTFTECWDRLGKDGLAFTLENLCDSLGMPKEIYFKRIQLDVFNRLQRDIRSSGALEVFNKASDSGRRNAIVFMVVGAHACILTNMQTHFPENCEIRYLKQEGQRDLHLIQLGDAASRLPNYFRH